MLGDSQWTLDGGTAMLADRYRILGSRTADSVEPKIWSALSRDCHLVRITVVLAINKNNQMLS